MQENLRAKDIQIILNIKKIRYEYLASKTGIKPDIQEVEGTGRAHLYSFKNLFQFAIAHHANKLGLTLREAKKLFEYLENFQETFSLDMPPEIKQLKSLRTETEAVLDWSQSDKMTALSKLDREIKLISDELNSNKLFARGIDINLSIICAYYGDLLVIYIKGTEIRYYHEADEKIRQLKGSLKNLAGEDLKEYRRYFVKTIGRMGSTNLDLIFDSGRGSIPDDERLNEYLAESDGYITINVGKIKETINKQLEYR